MTQQFCTRCYQPKDDDGFRTCPACRVYHRKKKDTYRQRHPPGPATADQVEAMYEPQEYANAGEHYGVDEWYRLCLACPLDDCVRSEGELQAVPKSNRARVGGCLIYRAVTLGLTPDEAVNVLKNNFKV